MINKTNPIICLAGKNEIATFGLNLLLKHISKKNIHVLCNSSDIGIDTWRPSLLKAAKDNKIKIISLEDCYKIKNLIFLSLEYDKIIVPSKFSDAKMFNIHFSKLPSYRGMFTSALPLLNDETESGVTLHEIDAGIDTGNIVDQVNFSISDLDTSRDLYNKYLLHSKKILKKNLEKILKGKTKSIPQSQVGSSYYSKNSIDYNNLKINLIATASQIRNQIRAYTFAEYQLPRIHDYFVNSAKVSEKKSTEKPGSILSINLKKFDISTKDYDLTIFRDKVYELFEAAKTNNLNLAQECIKCGVNVNIRNGNGWTSTIVAAFNGSKDVLSLLIKNGADLNLSSYKGTTPLMYAMSCYEKNNDRSTFDLLLKSGAKLDLVDLHFKSIIDYVKERNISGLF